MLGLLCVGGPVRPASAKPVGFKVEPYIRDLHKPTDLAWVEGTKRMFLSEEDTGRIRIINHGRLVRRPCINLDVASARDYGLTGLVVDPNFRKNKHLYAYYTNRDPKQNRISRFTVKRGRCTDRTRILGGLTVGKPYNEGGQMVFDKDGYLFVTTGDNNVPKRAQDLTNLMGKVLRLDPAGATPKDRIPDDNPFPKIMTEPRNAIWSYGHRNGFGLAYRQETDQIYETENGPNCDDEVNLIEKGKNYGWGPDYVCGTDGDLGTNGDLPEPPEFRWDDTIAPTDAWWYEGALGALAGSLYVGEYKKSVLHRFDFASLDPVKHQTTYSFQNWPKVKRGPIANKIVGVSEGPGRWLYVVGRPDIFRLVPGDSEEVRVKDEPLSFGPRKARVRVGGFVRWRRKDPKSNATHDIVQRQGLFDSPLTDDLIDFTATFSAGRFPYVCTVHAGSGMKGMVTVPPLIRKGPTGRPFLVRWATSTTDTGGGFDVDYRVGRGNWKHWKKDTTAAARVFGGGGTPVRLRSGKDYSFRVRSGRRDKDSKWSPVATQEL